MKTFRKIFTFVMISVFSITLISNTKSNIFPSTSVSSDKRRIVNVAVLLYSFEDIYIMQLKQGLENIQKENVDKVSFSFFDGKNNISIQNETFDSLLKSNIDLFIVNLADSREKIVEDIILKAKQNNVPLIFTTISPQVASKLSKYYDKVIFIAPQIDESGTLQGKILVNLWNTNKKVLDKNGDNVLQYIMLKGKIGSSTAAQRSKNVISAINDAGIKTEEITSVNANWSKELARDSISNLLLRYNGKIEAIISNNDAMAIGAIEALQKYGYNTPSDKSKYISVVGIDGLQAAKDLIDKGFMTGTVIIDPKFYTEALYSIGMNLINNVDPLENANYKYLNGVLSIPIGYDEYINKADIS